MPKHAASLAALGTPSRDKFHLSTENRCRFGVRAHLIPAALTSDSSLRGAQRQSNLEFPCGSWIASLRSQRRPGPTGHDLRRLVLLNIPLSVFVSAVSLLPLAGMRPVLPVLPGSGWRVCACESGGSGDSILAAKLPRASGLLIRLFVVHASMRAFLAGRSSATMHSLCSPALPRNGLLAIFFP